MATTGWHFLILLGVWHCGHLCQVLSHMLNKVDHASAFLELAFRVGEGSDTSAACKMKSSTVSAN